jgi:hypothetical protein
MSIVERRIFHINDLVANFDNAQLGFEPTVDADLDYRMWCGKDLLGHTTKWLAKDHAGSLTTLKLIGPTTTGSSGYLMHDTSGNITGEHIIDGLFLRLDGTSVMAGDIDCGDNDIENLADVYSQDTGQLSLIATENADENLISGLLGLYAYGEDDLIYHCVEIGRFGETGGININVGNGITGHDATILLAHSGDIDLTSTSTATLGSALYLNTDGTASYLAKTATGTQSSVDLDSSEIELKSLTSGDEALIGIDASVGITLGIYIDTVYSGFIHLDSLGGIEIESKTASVVFEDVNLLVSDHWNNPVPFSTAGAYDLCYHMMGDAEASILDMIYMASTLGPAGGGSLDDGYDFGGAGAGRTITADTGAVVVTYTPGGATVANLLEITAVGANWSAGSYGIKITTADTDLYALGVFNGATETARILSTGGIQCGGTIAPIGLGFRIGTGTADHVSSSPVLNDAYITGRLEVDGTAFFDGAVQCYSHLYLKDSMVLYLGTGSDSRLGWSIGQTPDTVLWGLGADSNGIVICRATDVATDFAHALQTNPTIWIQAGTTTVAQWMSFAHNQTNGVIAVGTGSITFIDANISGSSWSTTGLQLSNASAQWSAIETAYGSEMTLLGMLATAMTTYHYGAETDATYNAGVLTISWLTGKPIQTAYITGNVTTVTMTDPAGSQPCWFEILTDGSARTITGFTGVTWFGNNNPDAAAISIPANTKAIVSLVYKLTDDTYDGTFSLQVPA